MNKNKLFSGVMIGLFGLALTACSSSHQLTQSRAFRLKEVPFTALPSWNYDNFQEALPAMLRSCQNPNQQWVNFCVGLQKYRHADSYQIKRYIESELTPYLVVSYGETTGTITGYYEAEIHGTRYRTSSSQVPVYGLPRGYVNGKTYPTREDIEEDGIDAPIIAWANDPADLFVLHIQGSGRMITPDGEIKLGYAGNNNRKFRGLGSIFASHGITNLHSMQNMRQWLRNNPKKGREIMAENPRYIFFREIQGDSPYGSAGVVLTPERSVAVDKNYIPMHTPLYLNVKDPDGVYIQKLVVAQDIGKAIQGGIRADYFWGHGEKAFNKAGRMKSKGSYYLLLPKS